MRLIRLTFAFLLIFSFLPFCAKAEQMSAESFQAMTPYGVPKAHDTDTTLRKRPAIYWGFSSSGSVTYSTYTYQAAYNASCEPNVIAIAISSTDTSNTGYEVHIKNSLNTGFAYEVRQNANGTVTDVTSTVGIFWVSFGWY